MCMSEEIKQLFGFKYGLFYVLRIKRVIACVSVYASCSILLLLCIVIQLNWMRYSLHSVQYGRALHLNADDTKHNELFYIYALHSFI